MKWFRAEIAQGIEKVDFEKGIIYGVALNTEGVAKGHGVHLDKEFVEEVTKQGSELNKGLKSRFGHPNMSSTALGTFIGRYKNFRTTYKDDGTAVSRADLHLSETAKITPNGDLYKYVLEMAEKEPDMFGTSIVFTPGAVYRKGKKGERVYAWTSDDESELSKERFVELKELHANDVVDEPAANPDGLFSEFSQDQIAAKVTAFLDENEEVFKLFHDDEIRNSFMTRYESYKQQKNKTEVQEMDKQKQEGQASEENKGFFSKLKSFFKENGFKFEESEEEKTDLSEGGSQGSEAPEKETELSAKLSEATAEITSLKAQVVEKDEQLSKKEEEITKKDEQLSKSIELLKEAKSKLSALGSGLNEGGEKAPNRTKFKTYEDALAFQMDEKGMNFEEADKYCEEHFMHLYPES